MYPDSFLCGSSHDMYLYKYKNGDFTAPESTKISAQGGTQSQENGKARWLRYDKYL